MRERFFLLILLSATLCISIPSCKSSTKRTPANQTVSFTLPSLPITITTQEEALRWMGSHYWDNLLKQNYLENHSQKDSTILGLKPDDFKEFFVDYILLLKRIGDYEISQEAMRKLVAKAEAMAGDDISLLTAIMQCGEKILYDPASPFIDDQLYIPILDGIRKSKVIPDSIKQTYDFQYKVASLNMIGSRANDIVYCTTIGGAKRRMYDINTELLLIFFNNPDCSSCHQMSEAIESDENILNLTGSGRLKILSIYPDKDLTAWEENRDDFPPDWIYGYDPDGTIDSGTNYILRSIPSFYLLDKEKTILLKDVNADTVLYYLSFVK